MPLKTGASNRMDTTDYFDIVLARDRPIGFAGSAEFR
jgi:hypothetical protein